MCQFNRQILPAAHRNKQGNDCPLGSAGSRAISPDIGSYALPASSSSFARNSLALIPIARAVVSARLSLGPRSIPMAASREASKSAGDSHGTAGGATFRMAFSSRANRDLSLDCIPLSVHQNSGDGRSAAAWLLPHLIDGFQRDAAYSLRRFPGCQPFDLVSPECTPFVRAGHRPRNVRQPRFELPESS